MSDMEFPDRYNDVGSGYKAQPSLFDAHNLPPPVWNISYHPEEVELQQELAKCKAALEPFANLITPDLIEALPSTTRFSPKLTLAPFIAAHEALYGPVKESS